MDVKYDALLGELRECDAGSSAEVTKEAVDRAIGAYSAAGNTFYGVANAGESPRWLVAKVTGGTDTTSIEIGSSSCSLPTQTYVDGKFSSLGQALDAILGEYYVSADGTTERIVFQGKQRVSGETLDTQQ